MSGEAHQQQRGRVIAPAGTVIAGRYRVLRHLASGGMGAVYEVVHELTGRHHALKLLYESLVYDSVTLARFTQEARAATSIKSPHVVEVTDMGTEGAAPYLVMELLEGEDLGARMRDLGTIAPRDAVDIVGQACHALARAHAIGIIHRDLKPENLFLLDGDFVKVLDFGIAKLRRAHDAVGDGLTRDGNVVGTPEYMSPEQITVRSQLDHRADVYSLGVILYEMLCGRLPFEAEQLTELAVMIVTSDPPPLSGRARDLPVGLALVVHAAMARSADDRPKDCRQLARSLAPFGSEEVFGWVDDDDALDPVRGEPSIRFSRTTPRPSRSATRARRLRPSETPEETARREHSTLDSPLPARASQPSLDGSIAPAAGSTPPPARSPWLARTVGAGALLAIGGAVALTLALSGSGDEPTRTVAPPGLSAATPGPVHTANAQATRTAEAAPEPAAAIARAPAASVDAGAAEAVAPMTADAGTVSHGATPRGPRGPRRPRETPGAGEDSTEAPAPHHAPLKANPFLD